MDISKALGHIDGQHWVTKGRQRHRNIVAMIGICVEKRLPYLISEFVNGETIKYFIQNRGSSITWPQRLKICFQAADGMAYLHSTNPVILHRDLRCANIFINTVNDIVKVGDFGLIKLIQPLRETCKEQDCCCKSKYSACPVSIRWTAPEILSQPVAREGDEDGPISMCADVYSFGMVMLELVTCQDPYEEIDSESDVVDAIKGGVMPLIPGFIDILPQYLSLMEQCWNSNPQDRPTFKQLATRLKELIPQGKNFQKAIDSRQRPVNKDSESNTIQVV